MNEWMSVVDRLCLKASAVRKVQWCPMEGSLLDGLLPPNTGAPPSIGRRLLPFPKSGAIMIGRSSGRCESPWYDNTTFHGNSFEQWSDQYS
jgi:hypothetical protein